MRRRLFTQALFACASGAKAAGLGTTDRMYVDGVSIDPASGAVTLLLVIDLPLEDGLTRARARSKILSYAGWMKSKNFAEAYPQAKPAAGSSLVIAHVAPRNALGQSVLSQVEGYARELGFKTELKALVAKARAQ
jgi:hypothetical protein